MEPILDIRHIKKSFGNKEVHKDVNLTLYKNEILGLFGGSGSGKSVILRSIIGLEQPDSGEIIFKNKNIAGLSESEFNWVRLNIGYVFQNGALFDSLTVEENIAYPLEAHTQLSPSEIKKKVNDILELVDMKGTKLASFHRNSLEECKKEQAWHELLF